MWPEFGIDLAAPPRDLPESVAALSTTCSPPLSPTILVVPLAHPRYRRNHRRPSGEPMTRSDRLLSSAQWSRHIVGKISPWLQLDSPHERLRRQSEEAFKAEIAWAAHLGLSAVLLPPPAPGSANYARMLQWACLSTQHIKFYIRLPAADSSDDDDAEGPWRCWDRVRTLCEQSSSLAVALELGLDLPASEAELERWCGEPVAMLILATATFLTNKKGYPTLPRRHQAAFARLMKLKPKVVVSGREDGRRAVDAMAGGAPAAEAEGIGAYLQYLGYLISRIPAESERAMLEAPYLDYLQVTSLQNLPPAKTPRREPSRDALTWPLPAPSPGASPGASLCPCGSRMACS